MPIIATMPVRVIPAMVSTVVRVVIAAMVVSSAAIRIGAIAIPSSTRIIALLLVVGFVVVITGGEK